MAVNYLKKKKMYELIVRLASFDCEVSLSKCEYRFNKGMEWLRLHDNSYIYELCSDHGGNYLALNKYAYVDDTWSRKQISRHVYNGWGKMEVAV